MHGFKNNSEQSFHNNRGTIKHSCRRIKTGKNQDALWNFLKANHLAYLGLKTNLNASRKVQMMFLPLPDIFKLIIRKGYYIYQAHIECLHSAAVQLIDYGCRFRISSCIHAVQ